MNKKLNKAEIKWLEQMNTLAQKAPKRFSSYTIGDSNITIYDNSFEMELSELQDKGYDFGCAVDECEAEVGIIYFPHWFSVHATAG